MIDVDPVEDLDKAAAARAVADGHRFLVAEEARMFRLAAQWADLHNPDAKITGGDVLPGTERARRYGGDGTPSVLEFAPAEFGALQEMATTAAVAVIADALDVRHRLPRLWRLVLSGGVRVWKARKIAVQTRHLSPEAAGRVDAEIDGYVNALAWGRFLQLLRAKIIQADPVEAEKARRHAEADRFVRLGRVDEHGLQTLIVRARAGEIRWLNATIERIAEILAIEGDLHPLGVRRSKAIGILGQPGIALDMLVRHAKADTASKHSAGSTDGVGSASSANSASSASGAGSASGADGPDPDQAGRDRDRAERAAADSGANAGDDSARNREDSQAQHDHPGSSDVEFGSGDDFGDLLSENDLHPADNDAEEDETNTNTSHGSAGRELPEATGPPDSGRRPPDTASRPPDDGSPPSDGPPRPPNGSRPSDNESPPPDDDGSRPPGEPPPGRRASPGVDGLVLPENFSLDGVDLKKLRPDVVLYLHLDAATFVQLTIEAGRFEGVGPITSSQVRAFCGSDAHVTIQPVIDLNTIQPVDGYAWPAKTREALHLRTPFDVFPYGTSQSRRMQIDHTIPYRPISQGGPPGQTSMANAGPLTTYHHRVKTFAGWQHCQPRPGTYLWRSPTGHVHLVDHNGTHDLGHDELAQTLFTAAQNHTRQADDQWIRWARATARQSETDTPLPPPPMPQSTGARPKGPVPAWSNSRRPIRRTDLVHRHRRITTNRYGTSDHITIIPGTITLEGGHGAA